VYVSGEKVIAMRRVWEEVDMKRYRGMLSGSFIRYLVFVILYFAALHHQKIAEPAFSVKQGMKALFVDAAFQHPTLMAPMTYKGLRTEADFWAWHEHVFMPSFYDVFWSSGEPKTEFMKGALLERNRIANGVRWTQRRGELNKCSVPGKYNEFFPYCFPPLSDEGKGGAVSKEPYGPYYNPSKYLYNVSTQGTGWDDGGYVIMFPFNLAESEKKLRELKSDRWLDESSQWLRIDFTTYNPSANLITQVEFILEREASGRLLPRFEAHVIKSEIYLDTVFDYIQIVLEILVFLSIVGYILTDSKDLCMAKVAAGEKDNFLGSFFTWVDIVQILLFVISFIMYVIIIAHPTRGLIEVSLGPAPPAIAGNAVTAQALRDFQKDKLLMEGSAISLQNLANLERDYFAVQAITVMATLLRFLKYFQMSPILGGLLETLMIVKVNLLQFILTIVTCNIAFAYMGYILFGDSLEAFRTYDRSFFTLLGTLLGQGVSYAELADVNGVGAFILYLPFVVVYGLIVTQLVVAVIVEAYQVHLANRTKLVGMVHQFRFGLARMLPAFRRQAGPDEQYRYDGPDVKTVREWLRDWDWQNCHDELEMTEAELTEKLATKNVRPEDITFLFRRYAHCTRPRDPPPPEPEANHLIRELFKQIKVLSDAHAVAQRKLDAILAGQTM